MSAGFFSPCCIFRFCALSSAVVICITGNGLKTPDPLYDRLHTQVQIKPSLSAFDQALADLKSHTR